MLLVGDTQQPDCKCCRQTSATLYVCDWKCIRPVEIPAADLRVGDTMLSPKSALLTAVVDIVDSAGGRRWIRVLYAGAKKYPPYPEYTYGRDRGELVRAMRTAKCEDACCEFCVREVDAGRHYCRSHWDAWESPRAVDQTIELPKIRKHLVEVELTEVAALERQLRDSIEEDPLPEIMLI